ncbi:trigger factor [Candidatus Azobacteroides pseudotrichonymphae]|uniref:Trigger factor n=1 Tax=Azobacteroides pseudotrichonymphae genomovar. CFP2 TaxID=511995 RepID=B6YRI5_AZOPC|nr:trigger factor [Candidatus Azobacteroides pseudotrichonymphae]BAG83807.1 trigger factor [Candidatus Azobacteroides pseudotrichonymphae genomovar. CFP2]
MNITIEKTDDVNARITISVVKDDYQHLVRKSLSNLCKNVVIAGFRKGNVPQSIIQSMYGKNVLVEELNKLVSNELLKYIKENKLRILGEPLLIKKNLDLNNQKDYEFLFDIGLQPEVDIGLTKNDELPYYTIVVTNEMIENQISTLKMQYGKHDTNVDVVENDSIIKGRLVELDAENALLKNGINLKDAILLPFSIKDEMERDKFINKKIGDVIIFNPYRAFKKNETELSYLLKVKKTEIPNHQGNFSFDITEISYYRKAEINQELFDKLYGIGVVTSEKMFKEVIKRNLILQLESESNYRFLLDIKKILLEKIKKVRFPEDFLKRLFMESNANEKDFPNVLQAIKTQFIWNKIVEDNGIKVTSEDMRQTAKTLARVQFTLYNLRLISNDLLESYANEILKTEKWVQQLHNKALETKIIGFLKEKISLKPISVMKEEFRKIA